MTTQRTITITFDVSDTVRVEGIDETIRILRELLSDLEKRTTVKAVKPQKKYRIVRMKNGRYDIQTPDGKWFFADSAETWHEYKCPAEREWGIYDRNEAREIASTIKNFPTK